MKLHLAVQKRMQRLRRAVRPCDPSKARKHQREVEERQYGINDRSQKSHIKRECIPYCCA